MQTIRNQLEKVERESNLKRGIRFGVGVMGAAGTVVGGLEILDYVQSPLYQYGIFFGTMIFGTLSLIYGAKD